MAQVVCYLHCFAFVIEAKSRKGGAENFSFKFCWKSEEIGAMASQWIFSFKIGWKSREERYWVAVVTDSSHKLFLILNLTKKKSTFLDSIKDKQPLRHRALFSSLTGPKYPFVFARVLIASKDASSQGCYCTPLGLCLDFSQGEEHTSLFWGLSTKDPLGHLCLQAQNPGVLLLNGQRVTMLVIGIILAVRLSPHDNIGLLGSKGNHVSHWDHPRPAWVLMSQVLLVEPWPEDGQSGWVFHLGLPSHSTILVP